jgi:hypothetical protein
MCIYKAVKSGERGWTFIEAIIGVVLASILMLGFTLTIMAMRETIDRSLSIRVMDQYGNDMMRYFERQFENAWSFSLVASGTSGQFDRFALTFTDPQTRYASTYNYRANPTHGVYCNDQLIDPQFPPQHIRNRKPFGVLGESESFTVTRFTASNVSRRGDSEVFSDATVEITLGLQYIKRGTDPGEPDYVRDMTYSTVCFLKNTTVTIGD